MAEDRQDPVPFNQPTGKGAKQGKHAAEGKHRLFEGREQHDEADAPTPGLEPSPPPKRVPGVGGS